MYMIFFVLNDPNRLDEVLSSWSAVGVGGVTIIESSGMYRRLQQHIPMRYMAGGQSFQETCNYTLYAIVESQEVVQACLHAAEELIGDLDEPNTGVMAAWQLDMVKGLPQSPGERGE